MTLAEFERWLLCQIAVYHHAAFSAGRLCPAQMWEQEAARHGPLPVSVRSEQLFRQFCRRSR
ncbi:hypothetical protein [Novosphingobium sp.]|uniref:hypothetical protein n=1 Tax=Novosphingobium sp. TaxID=1874826 RepID=UPI0025FA8BDE|nr:hypothetical protein [Novosphingobium sp.]